MLGGAPGALATAHTPAVVLTRPPALPAGALGVSDDLPHTRVTAASPARRLPARPSATAGVRRTPTETKVTGTLVSLDGTCPTGLRRTATLYADGFEKGDLPEPTLTVGFEVAGEGAVEGTKSAHSSLNAGTVTSPDKQYHALFFPVVTTSASVRTVLSFRVRGEYGPDTAYVAVNDGNGWIEPSPQWSSVTVDVTSAVTAPSPDRAAGEMDTRILNYPQQITGTTTVDIDDVQIYQCARPAPTGVRGDFDGDGISDLLAVDTAGELWAAPGRRTGRFEAPERIGRGWNTMTWIGSPGDLTGDRRADVVARRRDGVLFLYAGYGMGSFSRARAIGVGWNSLTAILTPGDTNSDRVPEIMGRDRAGRLWRWSFAPGGRGLLRKSGIGIGFGTYAKMIAPGTLNADARGDLVGVRADGVMLAHYTDAAGRLGRAIGLSQGWNVFTAVTGPGDLTGDGRGDLVALRGDGTLWTFATPATKAAGIAAGTNANRFRLFG